MLVCTICDKYFCSENEVAFKHLFREHREVFDEEYLYSVANVNFKSDKEFNELLIDFIFDQDKNIGRILLDKAQDLGKENFVKGLNYFLTGPKIKYWIVNNRIECFSSWNTGPRYIDLPEKLNLEDFITKVGENLSIPLT